MLRTCCNVIKACSSSKLPKLTEVFVALQVLTQSGAYVKDDACRALTIVIMNASQLHGYAVRAMFKALTANVAGAEAPLLMVSTWSIGKGPSWVFFLATTPCRNPQRRK